jgi:hypothetical protein
MTRVVLALLLVLPAVGCIEGRKDSPLVRDSAPLRDRPERTGRSASTQPVSTEKP